jgi:hypothetical protein
MNQQLFSYFAYHYARNTDSALKKEANLKTETFRTELEHLKHAVVVGLKTIEA